MTNTTHSVALETSASAAHPSSNRTVTHPKDVDPTQWRSAISCLSPESRREFTENWGLKVFDPSQNLELHLDFSLLMSRNGFRELAELRATLFRAGERILLKQTLSLDRTTFLSDSPEIRLQDSILNSLGSRGTLQNKGHHLTWDFRITPSESDKHWRWMPAFVRRLTGNPFQMGTLWRGPVPQGKIVLNGETLLLSDKSSCSLVRSFGRKTWQQGTWVCAPHFIEENGGTADLSLEGLALTPNGHLFSRWLEPRVFRVHHKGVIHEINTLTQSFHARSFSQFPNWKFEAHASDLRFVGDFSGELKNSIGLTNENTNGQIQYLTRVFSPKGTLLIYRNGKLEGRFSTSTGTSLEFMSEQPNTYVGSYH